MGGSPKADDVADDVRIGVLPRLSRSEVEVAAGVAHLAVVHVKIGVEVADDESDEAPFFAEDAGEKTIVATSPNRPDSREGGHDPEGLAFLDGEFERTEIDFADRLFGDPVIAAADRAMGFLIIEGEVLDGGIDALGLDGFDQPASETARDERIFGIIFRIAATEGRTMDVNARGIPASIRHMSAALEVGTLVAEQAFVADCQTLFLRELEVVSLGNQDFGAVIGGSVDGFGAHEGDDAGRAIAGLGCGNAMTEDRSGAVGTAVEHQ